MSNKNFTHMPLGNPPVTLMLECVGVQGFTIPWNLVDRELVFSVPKFEYKTEDPYLPPLIGMNMTAGVLEKCRDSIAFVNCEAVETATSRLLKHPYSLRTDDDPIIRRMCDYHLAAAYCIKIITSTFSVYVYIDGSCIVVPSCNSVNFGECYPSHICTATLEVLFAALAKHHCWRLI